MQKNWGTYIVHALQGEQGVQGKQVGQVEQGVQFAKVWRSEQTIQELHGEQSVRVVQVFKL